MVKGKVIKDDDPLSKFPFKDGITLMMMGTAEEQMLKEPEKPILFLEDMTPEQRARALNEKAAIVMPSGLNNLGNTCYMNSVMQCLKRVNELKDVLKNLPLPTQQDMQSGVAGMNDIFAGSAGRMMNKMDVEEYSFPPYIGLTLLNS